MTDTYRLTMTWPLTDDHDEAEARAEATKQLMRHAVTNGLHIHGGHFTVIAAGDVIGREGALLHYEGTAVRARVDEQLTLDITDPPTDYQRALEASASGALILSWTVDGWKISLPATDPVLAIPMADDDILTDGPPCQRTTTSSTPATPALTNGLHLRRDPLATLIGAYNDYQATDFEPSTCRPLVSASTP